MAPRRLVSLFIAALAAPTAFAGNIQNPGIVLPPGSAQAKQQVVDIFTNAFSAYEKFAFGHDDLQPVSKTFNDGRNGWGASIVDAMTTMKIMGLDDLFQTALNFVEKIDFTVSHTADTVSVFETTIRYVAGMLSSYELNGNQPQFLVDQARTLTNKLSLAFTTGNVQVPWGFVNFNTSMPVTGATSNIAEAGTLTLEWSRLTKYTGNQTYTTLTENSVKQIVKQPPPLPGLAAQGIDPGSGKSVGAYVSWGGGSDSYFEYLLKYARIALPSDPVFLDTWRRAVDSSVRFLTKTSLSGNHLYVADFDDERQIVHIGSHLECFHAGNWIMGGRLLNNQTLVNIGLQLVDACWNTYASTETRIGPEVFAYTTQPLRKGDPRLAPNSTDDGVFSNQGAITQEELAFNRQHGFYITAADYILRPEVLESNFYAWRVTGNPKYIQNAMSAVKSIQEFLVVPGGDGGVSGINDVNNRTVTTSDRVDDTESFFFAEVMKYLYLTFDDPSHISLDEWVFNTECHPFKAPPLPSNFGQNALPEFKEVDTPAQMHVPLPQVSYNPFLPRQLKDIIGL